MTVCYYFASLLKKILFTSCFNRFVSFFPEEDLPIKDEIYFVNHDSLFFCREFTFLALSYSVSYNHKI